MCFCSFEEYKSDLDEEDQSDGQSAANNGKLDKEDELTLANLEDIKKEEEEDTYTSEMCRRTLAKVSFLIQFLVAPFKEDQPNFFYSSVRLQPN